MSVYTTIDEKELQTFLGNYDLGILKDFQGISAGIENTNYFVNTSQGKFVLTLFEELDKDEVPFYLDLMAHLNESGISCAHPIKAENGQYLQILKQKPTALVQRLEGKSQMKPSEIHCRAIGEALANIHISGLNFHTDKQNSRDPRWIDHTAEEIVEFLDDADKNLLLDEIAYQEDHPRHFLPQGIIHADLFRDNALFSREKLTGIIDFYYACSDALSYDLAVTVNDWCRNNNGSINNHKLTALVDAYVRLRPLNIEEKESWQNMLRAGALRFWLSRLKDLHFPKSGEITHTKDPDEFKKLLIFHRQTT